MIIAFTTPTQHVYAKVDVATTHAKRQRGLMNRATLYPFDGMLFVWEQADRRTMHMQNVRIPLDMLFVDHTLCVVKVIDNAQPNGGFYTSDHAVPYVIEVAGGWAAAHGVRAGARVAFHP